MGDESVILEGGTSRLAALATAAVATAIFGSIGVFLLSRPDHANAWLIDVGGIASLAIGVLTWPWQILDARSRRHVLTETSLVYRCGVLSRYELEIPFVHIQAVAIRQNLLQRLCGVGDVRVSTAGASGRPGLAHTDLNSVSIRSVRDFAELGRVLRERMHAASD